MATTLYCECEQPVMDIDHDAGCRRCGRPVDFSPAPPPGLERDGVVLVDSKGALTFEGARYMLGA